MAGPAAIILREPDLIVGLGCIVACALYGRHVPVPVVYETVWLELLAHAGAAAGHPHVVATAPGDCSIQGCA